MKRIIITLALVAFALPAFADEAPDFSDGKVTIGAAQKDPDTISSKFLEYRDIPQGGVLPYFRFDGKKGSFRWTLAGQDVTQKDQRYFFNLSNDSVRFYGDYTGIPHNFGNGGRSLLSPVKENEWRLSDTVQQAYQTRILAVPPTAGTGGQIDYNCERRVGFTPLPTCFSLFDLVSPGLAATPQNIDLKLTRGRSNLAFDLTPGDSPLTVGVTYFHERRSGTRAANGTSFGFGNVVETPEPLRYITQDFGVNAQWKAGFGVLRAGIRFNKFNSKFETFTWDNPFRVTDSTDSGAYQAPSTSTRNGSSQAVMALMPDNQATTEMVGATFKFGPRTRLTADVTLGQWKQDKTPFVPWTLNTSIRTPSGQPGISAPLPATALDGKIDTTSFNGFFTTAVGPIGLHARYRHYDFDNKTPRYRLEEGYVRFDAVWEDIPRITVPYGYTNDMFDAYATFGTGPVGLEVGWKHTGMDRTYRETESTSENVLRFAADLRGDWYSVRGIGEFGSRDFDAYDAEFSEEQSFLCESASGLVPCGTGGTVEAPANQTVLRRPDQAKRDLARLGGQVELSPGSGKFGIAASYFHTKFEYDQAPVECEGLSFSPGQSGFCPGGEQKPVGLIDDAYNTFGVDVNLTPSDKVNLYAFYNYEDGDILQSGRQSGATVNFAANDVWTSNITTKGNTFGAGADFTLAPDKWWLRLFARYQKIDGNNDVTLLPGYSTAIYGTNPALRTCVGAPGQCQIAAFDDTKLTYLYGQVRHQFAKNWSAAATLGWEDYTIDDAQTDNTLNYMPASFFLQANNRDYQAWVGYLTLSYSLN